MSQHKKRPHSVERVAKDLPVIQDCPSRPFDFVTSPGKQETFKSQQVFLTEWCFL